MSKPTWSKEDLIEAVKNSTSIRQVLLRLKLSPKGGSYRTIKKYMYLYDLDISHFTGQSWNKGRTFTPKRDIEAYLFNLFPIQSSNLRVRLLREGLFEHKCYNCHNTEWMNNPIPLELEHIDGDHANNNLSNLTMLCPNCHSLTDTYRGRKLKKERPPCPECKGTKTPEASMCYLCTKKMTYREPKTCCDCSKPISYGCLRCKQCEAKDRLNKTPTKIDWPPTSELIEMLERSNYTAIGRVLGVSDNAIRKRIKNHPV